jgi:hypothetical protein
MSEDALKRFLSTWRLRFTPPSAFNDPFELRPAFGTREEWEKARRTNPAQIVAEIDLDHDYDFGPRFFLNLAIGINIGILCLTEDPCHPLMWSHYADCHKGVVVGFDSDHPFFNPPPLRGTPMQFLRAVEYSTRRSLMSLEFLRKNDLMEVIKGGWLKLLKSQHPMFFTKSSDWSYEKEWRLVRQLRKREPNGFGVGSRMDAIASRQVRKEQLISISPAAIRSITLGHKSRYPRASDDQGLEDELVAFLARDERLSHIELWKVRLHHDSFALVRFCLDSLSDLERNTTASEVQIRRSGINGRIPRKP